ncbi:MAG: MarC family protein, partial [Phycisphaerales bacterium]|nr:MarC family protein [Phycisphaerales bacterium]
FLLSSLAIDFAAFRLAGSIILFLFALDMIFGTSKPDSEIKEAEQHADEALDAAVFPLSIPSIAGPGSIMAVIVRTDNDTFTLGEQAMTTAVMFVVMGIVLVAMLAASHIERLIGSAGASIISRIMGLILASIAADGALHGVQEFFALG